MNGNSTNYLSPIPTINQGLTSSSNLPAILRALAQQGSTASPANSLNQAQKQYQDDSSDLTKPSSNSTFGGYNYNNMAQGTDVSGSDLASAAQAGVASGLQFDPTTGTVS